MAQTVAIITGASSGMGREFAKQLARMRYKVDAIWLIARRKQRLEQLAAELKGYHAVCLCLDLCDTSDLNRLRAHLEKMKPAVRMLIQAAGVGYAGRFCDLSEADAVRTVDLNIRALTAVSHMVIPYMASGSHMVMLASASAFLPQTNFSVYAASKAYVLRFSESIRVELRERGIFVTAVCPGPVDTEFLRICNNGRPQQWAKRLVTVRPEPVVKKALIDAVRGKSVSIYGLPMKAIFVLSHLLPHAFFLHIQS